MKIDKDERANGKRKSEKKIMQEYTRKKGQEAKYIESNHYTG